MQTPHLSQKYLSRGRVLYSDTDGAWSPSVDTVSLDPKIVSKSTHSSLFPA